MAPVRSFKAKAPRDKINNKLNSDFLVSEF